MLRLLPRLRATSGLTRVTRPTTTTTTHLLQRNSYSDKPTTTAPPPAPITPSEPTTTNTTVSDPRLRSMQSPNRAQTWADSQRPRSDAMTGPRFEQTDIAAQPNPYAAIELIHAEPVRFVEARIAVCDGGGGPHGHPKVYINLDKPEIVPCGYCGLPFAHSHHKHYLESLPNTDYPLA